MIKNFSENVEKYGIRGNYRNKIAIVLHSVIKDDLQTSLVQHIY